jgi:hypothetical protein
LDGPADLVVAPDHRVELALLGALGQIDGEFFERLALLLGIRIVDVLPASHGLDRLLDRAFACTRLAQRTAHRAAVLERGEHEQLGGDVLVVALLGELVGLVQQPIELVAHMDVAAGALHCGQSVEQIAEGGAQTIDVDVRTGQQVPHRAALLVQQGNHQVDGLDKLVIPTDGQALSICQGHLKLCGQLIHSHGG